MPKKYVYITTWESEKATGNVIPLGVHLLEVGWTEETVVADGFCSWEVTQRGSRFAVVRGRKFLIKAADHESDTPMSISIPKELADRCRCGDTAPSYNFNQ